jgi:hypothetical protein
MTEQVALHVPLKPFVADGVVHGELIRLENHYDGELPDPFRITRAWLWADGAGALDSTVIGNLAVGIDPGGQYLSVNGQVEKEWPRTIKSLCVWEIFAGGSRQAILDHYPPIAYRGSAGDIVITAPEVFGNGSMAGAFLILFAESENWRSTCTACVSLCLSRRDDGFDSKQPRSMRPQQIARTVCRCN